MKADTEQCRDCVHNKHGTCNRACVVMFPMPTGCGSYISRHASTEDQVDEDQNEFESENKAVLLRLNGSSGNPDLEKHMALIFRRVFELWKTKQHDYGSANISEFGETGVLVRLSDKRSRLKNLIENSLNPANETRLDTWLDLCDYGAIGAACHLGLWPGVEGTCD